MQTITLIAVREGVVQLGSLKKVSPLSPFCSKFFYSVGPSLSIQLWSMHEMNTYMIHAWLVPTKYLALMQYEGGRKSKLHNSSAEEVCMPREHTGSTFTTSYNTSNSSYAR